MTALIILQIPDHIPSPRYRLFQRVFFDNDIDRGDGQIVGITWITSTPPQVDIQPGWAYQVHPDSDRPVESDIYCLENDLFLSP